MSTPRKAHHDFTHLSEVAKEGLFSPEEPDPQAREIPVLRLEGEFVRNGLPDPELTPTQACFNAPWPIPIERISHPSPGPTVPPRPPDERIQQSSHIPRQQPHSSRIERVSEVGITTSTGREVFDVAMGRWTHHVITKALATRIRAPIFPDLPHDLPPVESFIVFHPRSWTRIEIHLLIDGVPPQVIYCKIWEDYRPGGQPAVGLYLAMNQPWAQDNYRLPSPVQAQPSDLYVAGDEDVIMTDDPLPVVAVGPPPIPTAIKQTPPLPQAPTVLPSKLCKCCQEKCAGKFAKQPGQLSPS